MTVAPADSTSRASTPPSTRPHHPHPRSYGMDTSHSRPFFDSKWNRQGVGRIRFGIETHRFSQLSNQELAPIEMCPPDSPTLPHQLACLSARRGREEKEGRGELETGRLLTP